MRGGDVRYMYKVHKSHELPQLHKGNRFMMNLKLTHTLVQAIHPQEKKLIVEVGSGPGTLTRSLLTRPCQGILGIEGDTKYNTYLEGIQRTTGHRFRWINADILNCDEAALIAETFPERNWSSPWDADPEVSLFVNVPFDTVDKLLFRYCVGASRRTGLFSLGAVPFRALFQQPVAERICAASDTNSFGYFSVMCQNYFAPRVEKTLVEETFYPSSQAPAAIVAFRPRRVPLVPVDGAALSQFLKMVIRSRHKEAVHKGLTRAMPPEVAAYISQEVAVDPSLPMWKLTVVKLCQMAQLWVKYLEASNQEAPKEST